MADVILRNGKVLREALEELEKYKPHTKKDFQGHPYYKFSEYKQRMDEVFGKDGYSADFVDYETVMLPCVESVANPTFLKAVCILRIYGEDGTVVLSVSGIGTKEVERDKDRKMNYLHLNNLGVLIQQSAFKSATKMLNIFDCNKYEEDSSKSGGGKAGGKDGTGSQTGTSSSQSAGGSKQNAQNSSQTNLPFEVALKVEKPLTVLTTDKQSGLPTYIMEGRKILGNKKYSEKLCKVIMYPNCYKSDSERLNGILAATNEFCVAIKVTPGRDEAPYENVYIFKGFAPRGGK